MEGSITQLGLSNYLINKKKTGLPPVSFFKHNYKNYTNFVKDTRKISFDSNFDFGKKGTVYLDNLLKYGDIITNITLEVNLPDISSTTISGKYIGYCNGIGNALFKSIDFKIGGNLIDRHSGEWLDIWSQLFLDDGQLAGYNDMIKKYPNDEYYYDNFQSGKLLIPLALP